MEGNGEALVSLNCTCCSKVQRERSLIGSNSFIAFTVCLTLYMENAGEGPGPRRLCQLGVLDSINRNHPSDYLIFIGTGAPPHRSGTDHHIAGRLGVISDPGACELGHRVNARDSVVQAEGIADCRP